MTHWTDAQRKRLRELMDDSDAWVGYWCSDAHGYPARYGTRDVRATVGAVHEASGPLRDSCGRRQIHATRMAHRWTGSRVWIVALIGERRGGAEKSWSLKREIIGEILPAEAICDAGVAIRIGAKDADLRNADLRNADLRRANLSGADLRRANLSGATLSDANLSGANLSDTDLSRADLRGVVLRHADLRDSDLRDAVLRGADLGSWERGPDGFASRTTSM